MPSRRRAPKADTQPLSRHAQPALGAARLTGQPGGASRSEPAAPLEHPGGRHHGYRGENIDVPGLLAALDEAAAAHGWTLDRLPATPAIELRALRRTPVGARRNIYLSAGIHGDEPAGPLAALRLLQDDQWPDDASLWVCPCLNPNDLVRGTRENQEGIDLNRDYRHLRTPEVQAHVQWLRRQPRFDVTLCLHEDWESHGFYLYELRSPEITSIAAGVIRSVEGVCPIDHSPKIDGRDSRGGVITPAPEPDRWPHWPEALYLYAHHTLHSCTFEAPSALAMTTRVESLVAAARAAMLHCAKSQDRTPT